MSAYLQFFELEQSPFEGTSGKQVVLGTKALRDALDRIRDGLEHGVARICVSGGPGLGKTSLARALPKLLDDDTCVALVLDPSRPWEAHRGPLARQWGLEGGGLPRSGLLEAARDERLVVVVDQAETASEEFLDHLDVLLSYRSENDEPVVQSVLLARLGHGEGEEPPPLIWWLDRIQTLQLEFAPLPRDGVEPYIRKHLKRAGWTGQRLFTPEAAFAIHGYTGGIPGEVSKLCERLLTEAASSDLREIDAPFVQALCDFEDEDETPPAFAEDAPGEARRDSANGTAAETHPAFAQLDDTTDPDDEERFGVAEDTQEEPWSGVSDETREEASFDVSDETREEASFDVSDETREEASFDVSEDTKGEGSFAELLLAEEFDPASTSQEEPEPTPTIDLVEAVSDGAHPPSPAEALGNDEGTTDAAGKGPVDAPDEASEPDHRGALDGAVGLDASDEGRSEDEAADTESENDESATELEDYLSAPVSLDELRSIQGTLFARHARAIAAAAALALFGGLVIAWLSGGEPPPAPGMDEPRKVATSAAQSPIGSGSDPTATDPSDRLARLRGPVPRAGAAPRPVEPMEPHTSSTEGMEGADGRQASTKEGADEPLVKGQREEPVTPGWPETRPESRLAAEVEVEVEEDASADEEDAPSDDDLVDLRPAALRPGAADGTPF